MTVEQRFEHIERVLAQLTKAVLALNKTAKLEAKLNTCISRHVGTLTDVVILHGRALFGEPSAEPDPEVLKEKRDARDQHSA